MVKKNFHYVIQIILLMLFVFIALGMVFSRGICCADDAFFAEVAKNLAIGLGYSTTTQPNELNYWIYLFDPTVTTGSILILPTAFLIKLVGNTYWAPGLVMVSFWSILLLIIGRFANKFSSNKANVIIATFFFLFLSYFLLIYHYEQWYALLGEIPSALFIILAIMVYFEGDENRYPIITGILF